MRERELAAYWNGPMGLLRVLIEIVVSEAVEGGMPEAVEDVRGDAFKGQLVPAVPAQAKSPFLPFDLRAEFGEHLVRPWMRGVLAQYHAQYE